MQERGDEGAAVLEQAPADDGRAAPSEQSVRRREALSVYLEPLREARRAGVDLLEALDGLELDYWELDRLGQGLDESTNWQTLVAEGVAFRNKLQTDLGWASSEPDADDVGDLLVTDTALGIALLAESQLAVNQLIVSGEADESKRLSTFRNKISQAVADLRSRIGTTGYQNAETLSLDMVTPKERASWTVRRNKEQPSAATRTTCRPIAGPVVVKEPKAGKEPGAAKSHVKPMLMLLGLLVVVWGVFILPKLSHRTLPELTLQDISPRSEIRHVVARPPSLYVQLDTAGWRTLSTEDRLALVDDVGRAAAAAGYQGALFTLEDGRSAAQWFKERGNVLID